MSEAIKKVDVESKDSDFNFWMNEIKRYETDANRWEERVKKIYRRYKDERDGPTDENSHRYNILWSNLQVLIPAVYAKNPVPEVERRYKDNDPVGRTASEVLERCIDFGLKAHAFKDVARCSILDRCLGGRGVLWARYVPHLKDKSVEGDEEVKDEGSQVTDAEDEQNFEQGSGKISLLPEDALGSEQLEYEECVNDYVHWQDFGHTICRTWNENRAVWRIAYLTRQECIDRFGAEIGEAIPLSSNSAEKNADSHMAEKAESSKAVIYEIWDKPTKTAIWLCKEYPEKILDKRKDPLKLSGFWPCPRPLFATLANDSIIPVPDYVMYQDQADELDELTARISSITKAIKVAGVRNGAIEGLERVLSEGVENVLVPVDDWAMFAEKGGIKGSIDFLPMEEISQTLLNLHEAREKVKADLYEITGLSDILRGANDPSETATATRMKGTFASIRLREIQDEVSRFVCDVIRINGEIIAHHFSQETLSKISGVNLLTKEQKIQIQLKQQKEQQAYAQYQHTVQSIKQRAQQHLQEAQAFAQKNPDVAQQVQMQSQRIQQLTQQQIQSIPPVQPPQPLSEQTQELMKNPTWDDVVELLKNDASRNFRIDIETDSTIADDEEQDRQERLQFLEIVGGYLEKFVQGVQQTPQLAPLLGEMLMFAARGFKIGRSLENVLESTLEKLEQLAQNPPAPPPNPEMIKGQVQQQIAQAKAQADQQTEAMRVKGDMAIEQGKAQAQIQIEQVKAKLQEQIAAAQAASDDKQSLRENQLEAARAQQDSQNEMRIEQMRAQMEAHNQATQQTLQLILARLNNEAKIEVAEIAAQSQLEAAQVSAAKQAESGSDE
jgi:hypothetical protein